MPPKLKPKILLPRKINNCRYVWDELEVRKSLEKGAGYGVFSTKNLPVGTMIPIIGTHARKKETGTHLYARRDGVKINGDPNIKPYKKVGTFGLSISMMLNESVKKKFNCKFRFDYIVVVAPIKKGAELLLYYGDTYSRVGYDISQNKYIHAEYPFYNNIPAHKYPKNRKAILEMYDEVIYKCETTRGNQDNPIEI